MHRQLGFSRRWNDRHPFVTSLLQQNLSKTKPWWIWWLSKLATLKPSHQTADAFNRVPLRECSPWTPLSAGSLKSLEGGSSAAKITSFTLDTKKSPLCINVSCRQAITRSILFYYIKKMSNITLPDTLSGQCPPAWSYPLSTGLNAVSFKQSKTLP